MAGAWAAVLLVSVLVSPDHHRRGPPRPGGRHRAAGRHRLPLARGAAGAALAGLLLAGKYGQVVAVLRYLLLGLRRWAGITRRSPPRRTRPALRPLGGLPGRGPVRRRAGHLGGGGAARPDGHDRPRGGRAVWLAARAVRGDRPRPGFYGVLVASVGLALAVTLANISVIGMLVAASVIGGLGTRSPGDPGPPSPRSPGHGPQPISRRLAIAGWAVAVIVGGFGLLYVIGPALGTSDLPGPQPGSLRQAAALSSLLGRSGKAASALIQAWRSNTGSPESLPAQQRPVGRLLITGVALSIDNLAVRLRARHLPHQPRGGRRRHRHGPASPCRWPGSNWAPGSGPAPANAGDSSEPGPHRRGSRHRHWPHLAREY